MSVWMKHLEVVSEFKDLGLLVDSNLSWNVHEHSIVSKANKMLGLISRTCRGFADVKTLKTLHCSFFLSQLEHGSVVWSPYTQQNIDIIEHAQRRATRLILGSDIDYAFRVKKLNLQTLEQRRFMADVIFLYKALNGYWMCTCLKIPISIPCTMQGSDDVKLRKNFARTNYIKFSYFNG